MSFFSRTGKIVKPFVNFPSWMGWKQLSSTGQTIKDTAKDLAQPQHASREETFEQAVQRFKLTDEELALRAKNYLRAAVIYLVIAIILFIYAIYLGITAHFMATLVTIVLSVLSLTLAFRQHFWYFQIKQRKLGCTIKEWFHALIGSKV